MIRIGSAYLCKKESVHTLLKATLHCVNCDGNFDGQNGATDTMLKFHVDLGVYEQDDAM